jgi:sugar phosphate isomerase/epimerase
MIRLSYSTFGLTNLDFLTAIDEVEKAGYPGVEISFHRDQFNPFDLSDDDLANVRKRLASGRVKAACVATASHFFTPQRPHEPSLMSPDLAGRKRRIELVKRGIHVARKLGVDLVTFGSGFIRDEHVSNPGVDPRELLIDSIRQCLAEIRPDEDITLLIEPEPGMFIETMAQGLSLMNEIDSPRFRLHIDILHSYCSEKNYVEALAQAAPHIRYLHISDAQQGYNLKIVKDAPNLSFDLDFASYLVYFPETADYALLDRHFPRYFCDLPPGISQRKRLDSLLAQAGIQNPPEIVHYPGLYAGASAFDDEFFTYWISVPGLSYDVLERAKPILGYLRGVKGPQLVDKRIANTLTGIVHFHEIPGEGTLDFAASFKALADNGFDGYGSVELYHHVESWQKALNDSYRHLAQFV